MNRNDEDIIILSFILGVLAFFSFRERRIDTIKRNYNSVSTGEKIRRDWIKVGADLKKAHTNLTQQQ